MRTSLAHLVVFLSLVTPIVSSGAELVQDIQGVWRAKVERIVSSERIIIPGTDLPAVVQTLDARFLEGERAGEIVTFENDYIELEEGDTFYMNYLITADGAELYSVREIDRRIPLMFLVALFAVVVLAFSGIQGIRSLASLFGSLLIIIYVLLPALLHGFPPVLTSVVVGAVILALAVFLTHGFNRVSTIAYVGTVSAVVLTGILASLSVGLASLSGFASEEAIYLNLNTAGTLNFVGLLLAAIIIGSLGVLDDIAITQVAVVRELYAAEEKMPPKEVFMRALRVGKDHVSALVNTLVLAYTGAALPLLLLFSFSDASIFSIINREVFAAEIVRTIVGSIGLISTVPITTYLAVRMLRRGQPSTRPLHSHRH